MKLILICSCLAGIVTLASASGEGIRRIGLDGKEGIPSPAAMPGKDGIDRIHKVETSAIEVFPAPAQPSRGTVLLCPGGGYGILAINHEGYDVAKLLNGSGYDVAILLYQVARSNETRALALADAKAALALVRARGGEFGLSARKVGAMGFSAGGHLAARLAHETAAGSPPDFLILMYPAYLETGGRILDEVAPAAIPSFVYVAGDDKYAPSSAAFAAACQAKGVPCEFHKKERGGHGFGLKQPLPEGVRDWPEALKAWLGQLK
jgi:acetyl esterase/lipase